MKNSSVSRLLATCGILVLGTASMHAQNPVTGAAVNANPPASPATMPIAGATAANTPAVGGTVYNVRDYGAVGDGKAIDSDAVNKAIDAAESHGGGTVYFPAGYYLCFSIHLKTNITLYLDQGSWIVAAETPPEVAAAQPRGGRGGFGGGGGGGGGFAGGGPAGAAGTGGGGGRGTGGGGRGGFGAPAPRIRGTAADNAAPESQPQPNLNPGGFQPPDQSQAEKDFLAQLPPGTHMYDLIEHNMWFGLPAWRQPAGVSSGPTGPLPDKAPIVAQYQDFGHCFWHNSLIWGDGITNVSIVGPGTIYGRGLSRGDGANNLGGGNKSIALVNCRNVTLKDFTVWHGGWFCLLATGVDNFTIDNVKVDTNRDGFDIDCCQNVRINDCTINSPQDDGLVLKSSYAMGYARPTQNVTITNCQVSGFQEGTLLDGTYQPYNGRSDGGGEGTGRIKFGTESNGGFKNISISNCVFTHCRGLALESVDGAIIEDISITNITMQYVVNSPIYIRLGRRLRGPVENTAIGAIRRVNISNIEVSNAVPNSSIIIAGSEGHPVQDVQLSDIRISYQGGGTADQAQIDPPEDETQFYPEPSRLGTMPAYGMFARHVDGLTLRNVNVSYDAQDLRPAVVLDDVQSIAFDHFKAQHEASVPEFMLWNTRDFDVERSAGIADQHIDKMDQGVVAK